MLLAFSKTNDGDVYRELEIGQTTIITKAMRNCRQEEGLLELLCIKSRQLEEGRMGQRKETSRNKNYYAHLMSAVLTCISLE